MSLLSIVKDVMDTNGWPAPVSAVASSQDQNMRQSMALINKVLMFTSYKYNWPELTREYRFTTVPGQAEYDLPVDFHHLCINTAWNSNQFYQLKGSLTAQSWYRMMFSGSASLNISGYRVDKFGKKFTVFPVPQAAEDLVYLYMTTNLVVDGTGNYKPQYALDSDVAVIDEELVGVGFSWRWRQKKGLDYTAELAEYNAALKTRFSQYLAVGEIPVGGPVVYSPLTEPNTAPWMPQQ